MHICRRIIKSKIYLNFLYIQKEGVRYCIASFSNWIWSMIKDQNGRDLHPQCPLVVSLKSSHTYITQCGDLVNNQGPKWEGLAAPMPSSGATGILIRTYITQCGDSVNNQGPNWEGPPITATLIHIYIQNSVWIFLSSSSVDPRDSYLDTSTPKLFDSPQYSTSESSPTKLLDNFSSDSGFSKLH